MGRRLVSITLDNVDDLPRPCRQCLFWEFDPVSRDRAVAAGDPGLEKEAWLSSLLLDWGSVGKIAYVDGVPAGFVQYVPPRYAPHGSAFPTSPVSADAVLLTTGHVLPEFAGQGLGRMLVQAVAKDLVRRGVKALEAFGDLAWAGPACMLPAEYLLAVGFKTVRPHPRYPRLRLELRSTVGWRDEVEVAIERLLGAVSPDVMMRPVGAAHRSSSLGRADEATGSSPSG